MAQLKIVPLLLLLATLAPAGARAADPVAEARSKTKFAASPRERFVTMLWMSGETSKTAAAQEENLRIWAHLKLRDIQVESTKIAKRKAAESAGAGADADDFRDDPAPFEVDRDELEALVRLLTPRDDRPMANAFSTVLGPFRMRLDRVLHENRK